MTNFGRVVLVVVVVDVVFVACHKSVDHGRVFTYGYYNFHMAPATGCQLPVASWLELPTDSTLLLLSLLLLKTMTWHRPQSNENWVNAWMNEWMNGPGERVNGQNGPQSTGLKGAPTKVVAWLCGVFGQSSVRKMQKKKEQKKNKKKYGNTFLERCTGAWQHTHSRSQRQRQSRSQSWWSSLLAWLMEVTFAARIWAGIWRILLGTPCLLIFKCNEPFAPDSQCPTALPSQLMVYTKSRPSRTISGLSAGNWAGKTGELAAGFHIRFVLFAFSLLLSQCAIRVILFPSPTPRAFNGSSTCYISNDACAGNTQPSHLAPLRLGRWVVSCLSGSLLIGCPVLWFI